MGKGYLIVLVALATSPLQARPGPSRIESNPSDPAQSPVINISAVLTHGPILGAVTESSIRIWARADTVADLSVIYSEVGSTSQLVQLGDSLSAVRDFTGTVTLDELFPNTRYEYSVLLNGEVRFVGEFTTLPLPSSEPTIRFAIGADINLGYTPFTVFNIIMNDQPDFMLLIGDNIYSDVPPSSLVPNSKSGYESRYQTTWGESNFRNFMQTVPVFMIWDDHEILNDFWPGKNDRYLNARAAYDEYQGSHNPDPVIQGELYYTFIAGRSSFFVLDTRSFRSPNDSLDGPAKTMLGQTQKSELFAWLSNSKAVFKFIVSSVPFHHWATTGNDTWNGYDTERLEIFNYIAGNAIDGVVLLSGDQHWSGAFILTPIPGFQIYEFMPTPLAIRNLAASVSVDPEILFKSNESKMYGLFEIQTTARPYTINVKFKDDLGIERYSVVLSEPVADALTMIHDEDTDAFITLSGAGGDTGELSYMITSLPVNGDLYQTNDGNSKDLLIGAVPAAVLNVDGHVIYTPAPNGNGQNSGNFSYSIRNGLMSSVEETITIHTLPVNDAPVLAITDKMVQEDDTLIVVLEDTDIDGDLLTYSASSDTVAVTTTIVNSLLTVIPAPQWNGVTSIYVSVNDGQITISDTFTVSVIPVNDAPSQFHMLAMGQDSTVSITQANFSDSLVFTWTLAPDVDGDSVWYGFEYEPTLALIMPSTIEGTTASTRFDTIVAKMVNSNLTSIVGWWDLYATDGKDTTWVANGPFILDVDISTLDIQNVLGVPKEFALYQNYPNPFNPASTIRYDLPEATHASLIIYDIGGREVIRLVDGDLGTGYHQVVWLGRNRFGRSVPSGIYIARLLTPRYTKSIKMVLLK